MTTEQDRIENDGKLWRTWGPYLSERAWGTVREDYSPDGDAWNYLSHDMARSKAYRWNEDGIGGICDNEQRLCLAFAFWNGQDPILKERLFGLTGPQGNHGEDVKEYYYYLDSTPSHSRMQMLYKYPQATYPYQQLIDEAAHRTKSDPEYELIHTGVFDDNRYFDIFLEYAKYDHNDILIQIKAFNRGDQAATLYTLPTLWFRNTWSWDDTTNKPHISQVHSDDDFFIRAEHNTLGEYSLYCEAADKLLFTNNETNLKTLYGVENGSHYYKDAFHEYVVKGNLDAVNPDLGGTKAAALYKREVEAGASVTIRLRLCANSFTEPFPIFETQFQDFDQIMQTRRQEADEFYDTLKSIDDQDLALIQRQAFAGMLWSKQFYHFDVERWLEGDPTQPPPPPQRKKGRNNEWKHLNNSDVLSMPDKWEYPWFAAWDLAFHTIPLALLDSDFAKTQLDLLLREWYQHPNGQIPAYEWAFGDVNPPVFAWAAWRVYKIEEKQRGKADRVFLERIFHKLLINFTWWVNRKDSEGNNVFEGGFLGLDNIGVFDRSAPLPWGGTMEQSDGTSWMGMFSLNMMKIALELARDNQVYQDIATKFFEHFLYIAKAMNDIGEDNLSLWDKEDEFFYDVLHLPNGTNLPLKVRSMVGLIPLLAVETIDPDLLDSVPNFKERLIWFLQNRPQLANLVSRWQEEGVGERRLITLVRGHRLKCILRRVLDDSEFLSEYGIRSLSKYHDQQPYNLEIDQEIRRVHYEPAESRSGMFGGNSNWRGPIWLPLNYIIIEALQKFHHYYGNDFTVECPARSGEYLTLEQIADELSRRLIRLFAKDENNERPIYAKQTRLQQDPHWRDYLLFFEYFNGDTGEGLGASHQTGWTGLIAKLIHQQVAENKENLI